MNGSGKHTSLLHYGNNYGSKIFYSTGPWHYMQVQPQIHFDSNNINLFFFVYIFFLESWVHETLYFFSKKKIEDNAYLGWQFCPRRIL